MEHSALSSVFSIGIAVLVWATATAISLAGWSTSRRNSSTTSLYSTIVGLYVDPPPFADPIKVQTGESVVELKSLRAARVWAKHYSQTCPDKWMENSTKFGTPVYSPENRAAYMIANSVNDLGSAAFTGGVPLGTIVGIVGDVVIDDWLVCRDWVAAYRQIEDVCSKVDPDIAYHRRYGEWIALLSLLMFKQNWQYKPADELATFITDARERFLAITAIDASLLPLHVTLELVRILPFRLKAAILLLHLRRPAETLVSLLERIYRSGSGNGEFERAA